MKAPVGLLSDRTVLRQQDGGAPPRQVPRLRAQRSNESPSGAFKRQNGLRQQMEGPRPDKFADVYTSALLAGAMKPLKVLSKFENYFLIRTVSFQVHLEAGGYFLLRRFLRFHLQQAGIQHKNTLVPHLNGR